jgi:hypothetical protein
MHPRRARLPRSNGKQVFAGKMSGFIGTVNTRVQLNTGCGRKINRVGGGTSTKSPGFRKFEPIAKDVLRLYDHVRFKFKEKYNAPDESGKPGRFGGRKETKDRKRGSRRISTYYFLEPQGPPVQGDVPIEKGFALPLISGFRVLIREDNGKFEWLTDPFQFFDTWGTKLARAITNASDLAGGDPHLVGRDPQAYRQLTSEVRRWYLEGEVAKRHGSKK